jgi:sugar O-acyltransferase (sialic acid O-acetyltransferase NeuD family)
MVAEAAVAAGMVVGGFLNDRVARGTRIGGFDVLGRFDDWRELPDEVRLIAAFPLPGASRQIVERIRELDVPEERKLSVVHPASVVSSYAVVGAGCFIGPCAVVEHGAELGSDCIVRGGAYVSHDVRLGQGAFVGSNATLLGRSSAGTGAHVGPGSVIREGCAVGDFALIGVGSVVIRDVAEDEVVAGNPARRLPTSAVPGPSPGDPR